MDSSATLAPLLNATPEQWLGDNYDPDVLIAIPNLGIDHIGVTVEDVRAHVRVKAKVLDLLELEVGADVSIAKVEVNVDNIRVQAMVKIRLDNVVAITGQIMNLLNEHPEILSNLTGGLGRGLEGALAGKSVERVKVEKELDDKAHQ